MARGLFRKTSFNKMVGAYRSQWKRFWLRLFTFGMYGRKGTGWWRDPKKAWYNFWYHRTSISIPRILGYKPSRLSLFCAMLVASVASIFAAPVDATRAGIKAHKLKADRAAGTDKTDKTEKNERKDRSESSRTGTGMAGNARTSPTSATQTALTSAPVVSATTATPATSIAKVAPAATGSTSLTGSKTRSTGPLSRAYGASPAGVLGVLHSSSSTVQPQPKGVTTPTPEATHTPALTPVRPVREEKLKQEGTRSPSQVEATEAANEKPAAPIAPTEQETKEPDENAPKSKPKHEGDQYIRKRMIIAGSSYCDKAALAKLAVGTYFELVAEPTNPYDKDAVMLVHDGEKIGYIAKQDKLAFVTCLKLKRRVYGVITDIIAGDGDHQKYEFETWFDSIK